MKIYLIQSDINGILTYKIGKTSRDINLRLQELSTGNAGKLTIIYEYDTDNANLLEKSLHYHYKHIKLAGEWFSDKLDISQFISTCQFIDKNLKTLKYSGNPFTK